MQAYITYELFGAKGDGKTNDIAAIIAAHDYANAHKLPVIAHAGATYYIGNAAKGAVIKTDTDWTGASFILDDTEVPLHERGVSIFTIIADKAPYMLEGLTSLKKAQPHLGVRLPEDSVVVLTDANTKRYIRFGPNANMGSDQQEIIVVRKDGTVDAATPITWDYEQVTGAQVIPMDPETVTVKGGTFTTVTHPDILKPNYYQRGICLMRSNVVIDGLTHYVTNEHPVNGAPYGGILTIRNCADILVKNCTFTPHITFRYVNAKGVDRTQGTYDITPARTANLTFENCTQTVDILDTRYWGVMGSNFCKNITLDGCSFSRFDAHQGVANVTVLNSTLGHQCLNAIGFGTVRVENSTLYGITMVNLRADYGSTWEGDVIIRNCTWIPRQGKHFAWAAMIGGSCNTFHDFGYKCYMPHTITIENLHVDDSRMSPDGSGIYLFNNIVSEWTDEAYEAKVKAEGYPYEVTKKLSVSGYTSFSGNKWKISLNPFMYRNTEIVDGDC
ncbi:MAG: hypothetical protein E7662_03875 [Ruminococcaceae bacterium]|nr:hypothetical protein [Oscillospiraceae bacterium]